MKLVKTGIIAFFILSYFVVNFVSKMSQNDYRDHVFSDDFAGYYYKDVIKGAIKFPDIKYSKAIHKCIDAIYTSTGGHYGYRTKHTVAPPIIQAMLLSRCSPMKCSPTGSLNILCATKDNVLSHAKPNYIQATTSPCMYISYNQSGAVSLLNPSIEKRYPDSSIGLACLPAVYVLGFAKSGSTDLHYRLLEHPHILGGEMKELRFWYGSVPWLGWRKFYGADNQTLYDLFSYMKMFENATNYIGSQLGSSAASTGFGIPELLLDSDITMYRPEAVVGITHLVPYAKAIVIMRDPVEREFSFYRFLHSNDRLNERNCFANTPMGFHEYVQNEFKKEVPFAERQIPFQSQKHQSACYANYIELILRKFKPGHVLLLQFESYSSNPQSTIHSKILPFLKLKPFNASTIDKIKQTNTSNHYSMLNATRALLQQYFRPCNMKLSKLLSSDKWRWNY